MQAEPTTLATFLAQLRRVALIARLRRDLRVQELIEIGDALLAAPVLVVEIAVDEPEGIATIGEFRRRYGEHLLVGAAAVTTLPQMQSARDVGAHFFATPTLDAKLLRFAREEGLFCLPHIKAPVEARLAHLEGCPAVSLTASDLLAYPTEQWPLAVPLLASDVEDGTTVAACRMAGAVGVRLERALLPTADWSHAEIITTARRLRQSWEGRQNDDRRQTTDDRFS